jgi:hypothetical protein
MRKHNHPGEAREGLTALESRLREEERRGGGILVGGWEWGLNRRRGRGGDKYIRGDLEI